MTTPPGRPVQGTARPAAASAPRHLLLVGLHLLAVVLAALGGHLARWAFHAGGVREDLRLQMDLLVLLAVLIGLLSVAAGLAAIVLPAAVTWRARLVAQIVGVLLGSVPTLLIAVIGVLTMGSLLPQIGNLMGGLAVLAALVLGAVSVVLHRTSSPGPWPILPLASVTGLVVSFYSVWWLLNGVLLLLRLLGVQPA